MSASKRYIGFLKRHQWIIDKQCDSLTHGDSMLQLPFRSNCLNWNLGHILVYRLQNLGKLDSETNYDEEEFKIYGGGSEPLTDSDMAVPLDELLTRLTDSSERMVAALEATTDEQLAEITDPEKGSSLESRLDFHMFHEAIHLGELGVLRQLAGKDDKVI